MGKKYTQLIVDISGQCNGKCPYCPTGCGEHQKGGFLDPEKFLRILDYVLQSNSFSGQFISLYNWGEPFLHPDINKILKIVNSFGLRAVISSNFLYLPQLSESSIGTISNVTFSLSGFSQDSYGRIHGGILSKALTNFDTFLKSVATCQADCQVMVNWHRYRFNEVELPEAMAYFKQRGVHVLPSVANLGGVSRTADFLRNLNYNDNYDRNIDSELFTDYLRQRFRECSSLEFSCPHLDWLIINHEGKIVQCCGSAESDTGIILGDIFDKPIEEFDKQRSEAPACKGCIGNGIAQYSAQYCSKEDFEAFERYLRLHSGKKILEDSPVINNGSRNFPRSTSTPVTINMCVYNEERHMSSAIQSLLDQTYDDFKLVIVNNGSTDSSGEIAENFAETDPRVNVIHNKINDPLYAYKAIIRTDTPFYVGAAGHDLYAPRFLEKCLEQLDSDAEIVLAYPRAHWFQDETILGEIPGAIDTRCLNSYSRALAIAYGLVEAYQAYGVYRLAALRSLSKQDVVGFDHVMLTELAFHGSFAMVNEPLFFMRRAQDWGNAVSYRKKHWPNEKDGVSPFLRMADAYMRIADRIQDPTDKQIMKMAFFTSSLLRYRHVLGMFGESVDSLFARPGFKELEGFMTDTVRFIEQDLMREYACKSVASSQTSAIPESDASPPPFKPKPRVAGEGVTGKDLTAIQGGSEFERKLGELVAEIRPAKVIETGTYLGTGTTRIIASAMKDAGIADGRFYTVECHPSRHQQAVNNLTAAGLAGYVTPLCGLSVPRSLLPNEEQIRKETVDDVGGDDIFVDHQEENRVAFYHGETNFPDIPDDLIGRCLSEFDNQPDMVLLDSAGHMGNLEFNYLLERLKGECYIVLDDIKHIKHHKSYLQIQGDPRFTIVASSDEKFGFCMAKFTPNLAPASEEVRKILWVRTDSIGDAVLAMSMLPHVKARYPKAEITVLCQDHIAELYEFCPHVDSVMPFNKGRAYMDVEYRDGISATLCTQKYDIVLNSVFSREPLTDILALNTTATQKIAYDGDFANRMTEDFHARSNPLYSHIIPNNGGYKLELERHREFLQAIGIDAPRLLPVIWTTLDDGEFAENIFRENGLDAGKTVVLFAGAQAEARTYDKYGLAMARLCEERGFSVIALGSENDFQVNERNLKDLTGVKTLNLCGKTTLRQSAEILRRCLLAVGAETSMAHIACAVGTPNVVLLGGGHFGRFMPYSSLTSAVVLPLECFCCNWLCKYDSAHCVKGITHEVISEAVSQTLESKNNKARIFLQGENYWHKDGTSPNWKVAGIFYQGVTAELIHVTELADDSLQILSERFKENPHDRENTSKLIAALSNAGFIEDANHLQSIYQKSHRVN